MLPAVIWSSKQKHDWLKSSSCKAVVLFFLNSGHFFTLTFECVNILCEQSSWWFKGWFILWSYCYLVCKNNEYTVASHNALRIPVMWKKKKQYYDSKERQVEVWDHRLSHIWEMTNMIKWLFIHSIPNIITAILRGNFETLYWIWNPQIKLARYSNNLIILYNLCAV